MSEEVMNNNTPAADPVADNTAQDIVCEAGDRCAADTKKAADVETQAEKPAPESDILDEVDAADESNDPEEAPVEDDAFEEEVPAQKEAGDEEQVALNPERLQDRARVFGNIEPAHLDRIAGGFIEQNVRQHCLDLLGEALENGYAGGHYAEAKKILEAAIAENNPSKAVALQRYLDPGVIDGIYRKCGAFAASQQETLNQFKTLHSEARMMKNLQRFEERSKDWLSVKEHQDVLGMALNLNFDLDPNSVKQIVDTIEKSAVKRYLKKSGAANEARQKQAQLSSGKMIGGGPRKAPDKWMTLEQFNQLSESEYDAKRDQIVRQIELERAGKIPKRLTR
ncbi:MAG: hypothetical protein LBU87_05155 [Lactobacillales bacterium]|nr:hypothetical protein [Lactobacillales bacterium]